jgi:hypothetical protein
MSKTAFIAFGSSCISKCVPLDGTDSWDVFRWHYGGWRWHDNAGNGTVEYIRTNAIEITAPMSADEATETRKQSLPRGMQELEDAADEAETPEVTPEVTPRSVGSESRK